MVALGSVALAGSMITAGLAVRGRRRQLRLVGSTDKSADE
jgi:hypothetical protein